MKVRDSGMPAAATWEGFFDPGYVLGRLAFDVRADVVDFGCGYGTFTIAAASRTTGIVHAIDVEEEMVESTLARARSLGHHLERVPGGVVCVIRDQDLVAGLEVE